MVQEDDKLVFRGNHINMVDIFTLDFSLSLAHNRFTEVEQ